MASPTISLNFETRALILKEIPHLKRPTKCTNCKCNRSQDTLLIWSQLLRVLAPTSHHQRVFLQQTYIGPTNISGILHSPFQPKSYKPQIVQTPNYTSTLLHQQYHYGIGLLSYTLTLRLLMSYIYGAPSKARNVNVVYIYGPTFGNAETVSFYLLHNVSTLNQCREFSCVTFVCKHFAS